MSESGYGGKLTTDDDDDDDDRGGHDSDEYTHMHAE